MANGYGTVYGNNLSDGLRASKYMYLDAFSQRPQFQQFGTQTTPVVVPTLPTAVQDNVVDMHFPNAVGNQLIQMYQSTQQTLLPALHATKGLEIGLDEVNNEAVEYVPGGNHALNPLGYLAGTDPGILIRATLEIADVSGTDQLFVGFRKQENYTPVTSLLTTGDPIYTDLFGVGISGSVGATNLIKTISDIGNAGSATVTNLGFVISDGDIIRLTVMVTRRKTSVSINGTPSGLPVKWNALGAAITSQKTSTAPVYTFTSGLFLIPTIIHRYDATTPGAIYLRRLEVAQLLEVGLQKENRKPS